MELRLSTQERIEMLDITPKLEELVSSSHLKEGVVLCYVPHTTAGLIINENADPTVVHDILTTLQRLVPREQGYAHAEGNSQAHIISSIVGNQVAIPVVNGKLCLGTWQGVFFVELDGPRQRRVTVMLIPCRV
ncbi:YjbQ family protein [Candidatus Woesearchaeota archaeon]|nr:MAG: YjbQ family protein [Candidatus Woesearchaeota archaeon]